MDCNKIEQIIVDDLTSTARESDVEIVRLHLSECSKCREQFLPMLELNKTFSRVEQHEIPIGFDERFWQKLSAQKPTAELSPRSKFIIEILGTNVRFAFISMLGALLSIFSPIESHFNNYHWNIIPTLLLTISLLIFTFIIKQSYSWNTLIFYRRKNV